MNKTDDKLPDIVIDGCDSPPKGRSVDFVVLDEFAKFTPQEKRNHCND